MPQAHNTCCVRLHTQTHLAVGQRVCTVLEQQLHNRRVPTPGCLQQRRQPRLRSGCVYARSSSKVSRTEKAFLVHTLTELWRFTSAPFASSILAASTDPNSAATINGVEPNCTTAHSALG